MLKTFCSEGGKRELRTSEEIFLCVELLRAPVRMEVYAFSTKLIVESETQAQLQALMQF